MVLHDHAVSCVISLMPLQVLSLTNLSGTETSINNHLFDEHISHAHILYPGPACVHAWTPELHEA